MSGFRDYLRGLSVLISDAAISVLMLSLIPVFPGISYVRLPVGYWLLFLMAHFLVNLIMTGRGLAVNLYLVWNLVSIAAGTYFIALMSECPEDKMTISVLMGTCTAAAGIHGAYAAWRLPRANTILKYVDSLVVILAFYLYAVFGCGWAMDAGTMLLAAGAMILDMAVISQIRTNDESVNIVHGAGTGSLAVLFLIVLLAVGITGAVTGFASGQIHSAVDVVIWILKIASEIVNVVLSIIGTVLGWLIILLFSIFPSVPQASREKAQSMVQENVEEIVEKTGAALPLWFWQALGAILLIAAAAAILSMFRGIKISRMRLKGQKKKAVRKSYLFEGILQLIKKLKAAVWFELCYRRYRKTPAGLFVYADRTGKRVRIKQDGVSGTLGRKKGEAPGEYMRRLAGLGNQPPDGKLYTLARLLDETYYRDQKASLTREECREYEAAIDGVIKKAHSAKL